MPSLLFCGPKMAACGIVISIWGVIMLAMLGIFFSAKSAVLIEDVPFTVLPSAVKILLRTSTICTTRSASTASSPPPSTWWWAPSRSARSDSTSVRSTWSHKQTRTGSDCGVRRGGGHLAYLFG